MLIKIIYWGKPALATYIVYTINYLHIIDKGEPEEEDKRMAIMGSFFNVVIGDSYQSPPS